MGDIISKQDLNYKEIINECSEENHAEQPWHEEINLTVKMHANYNI